MLTNIYVSITPDILHQGLQGIVKYLVAWLRNPKAFGTKLIDARCRTLPRNHHIKTFPQGISILSRVSGQEHKDLCRILLFLFLDLRLPSGFSTSCVIQSVRALLNFLYLAQLPSQTSKTIRRLDESLGQFHANKSVFVELGIRKHFNIPKFHSLTHYCSSITLFGTTDNYNTEHTERLHIDYTKDAYRATNCKDEFLQMTTWLERHEKVLQHGDLITQRQQAGQAAPVQLRVPMGAPQPQPRSIKMALHPSIKAAHFDSLALSYGANQFQDALADFIARINYPNASTRAQNNLAEDILLPFHSVPVFNKIKFVSNVTGDIIDAVHVRPEHQDTQGCNVLSRFNTVVVRARCPGTVHGINGMFL